MDTGILELVAGFEPVIYGAKTLMKSMFFKSVCNFVCNLHGCVQTPCEFRVIIGRGWR